MSLPGALLFSAIGKSHITGIDWLMIALYFSILLGVAWWVVRKGKDSAADYFLAGRNLGWWIIGASIFASTIGSEHIVGLGGSGATGGVVFARLLPELRLNIGGTSIDSFWIGSVLVIVLTGLYTTLGGMRAVAYNDAVQVTVLIAGSALLTGYGLVRLGGWSELRHWCGSDMFNLWKPLIPAGVQGTWAPVMQTNAAGQVVREAWYFNGYFPWLGMLFCAPIIGLWYWCTDQYIVQRALGAPNEAVARRGSIFASFLKLFPVYLFIIPGLICYALAKSGRIPALAGIVGPDGKAIPGVAQGAFPMMVQYLLPPGLRGLVVAGLLSALMGSLAGVFNACSTLFTVDLYQKWKPAATQHQIVRVGRMATGVMVLVALAWIPVIKGASGLYV